MFKRSMYAWINGFWFISNVILLKTAAVVLSGIAKPEPTQALAQASTHLALASKLTQIT